ncbi:MAG: hypothetical protein RMK99_00100 [Anaerolineales bacterium]|nr:hypothetical protein [Anaerolineales bacterium]
MCQYETILAEQSSTRYISSCEHGTVHVMWDGLGLHLRKERFHALADETQKALRELHASIGQHAPHYWFRLRVNTVVLGIPYGEFVRFVALLSQARLQMEVSSAMDASEFGPAIGRIHSAPASFCAN